MDSSCLQSLCRRCVKNWQESGADPGAVQVGEVQIGDRPKLHILDAGIIELGYEAFFGSFTFLNIGFGDT
jgi:hypothetical protein